MECQESDFLAADVERRVRLRIHHVGQAFAVLGLRGKENADLAR